MDRTRRSALRELARVDAHDEGIVLAIDHLGEASVVFRVVQDHVAVGTGLDAAVGDRNRVDTVAIRALVRAAVLGRPRASTFDSSF